MLATPVAPVLHTYVPEHPEAVSTELSPAQMLVLEATTVGAAPAVVTVTFTLFDLALSQVPTLHTAVYSVVEAGLTTIELPVKPFDQTIVPSQVLLVVSVVLWPAQINVGSAAIVGAVGLPTVIVTGADGALTHLPIVQVAV